MYHATMTLESDTVEVDILRKFVDRTQGDKRMSCCGNVRCARPLRNKKSTIPAAIPHQTAAAAHPTQCRRAVSRLD